MRAIFVLVILICISGFLVNRVHAGRLLEKYVWKQLSFAWRSYADEQNAIHTGRYIPNNNMPLSMDLWGEKVFITVPRWRPGVAASLAYIQLPTDERSPILHPYPDWESHDLVRNFPGALVKKSDSNERCSRSESFPNQIPSQLSTAMVSPFRVKVDECDRLWVFDSGLDAIITPERNEITLPTLILFDLNTNQVLHRYTYLPEFVVKTSSYPNLVVDITDNDCTNAFVYMPDVTGYGLVVYSLKEDKAWRITHNYFHFDPLEGNLFTGGVNYQVPDGIFGIALGNKKTDNSRDVYFHALSSTKEFVVSNKVIQNETWSTSKESYYDFMYLGDRGINSQSTIQLFDPNTEVIFYSQINKDAVGCWNSRKPYTPDMQGLVDSDSSRLNFVNAFFIDRAENLWVLSNKLANIIFGDGVNATEDNYRILGGRISKLIRGTPCDYVDDSYYLQFANY